jgi:hypothetical protein
MKLLNNLVVIAWHTPRKYVMVLIGTMSIRLSKDNHDSWDGFSLSFWLGHVEVGLLGCGVGHGETPWHDRDCYL